MQTSINNVSDARKEEEDIALGLQLVKRRGCVYCVGKSFQLDGGKRDMTAPDRITSDRQTLHCSSLAFSLVPFYVSESIWRTGV